MKRKYISSLVLVLVFLIMSMGLWTVWPKQNNDESAKGGLSTRKLKVVTSFYPLYFLASEIGGVKIEVRNITPAGVEPHDYEPTARDMMAVQQAELLILNGGKFEAWSEKVKEDFKGTKTQVLGVGDNLIVDGDPHIWLSPELLKKEIWIISEKLTRLEPKNAQYFLERSEGLVLRVESLQAEFTKGLMNCRTRDFITSHKAFGYLANDFGLREVAIAGLTPEEEPSTKQLAVVAKLAREKNIQYIFFEKLVNPKLSETIAQEIGARTLVLDPVEGISDNDLKQGKDYLTIMTENLKNLRIALECQ